jgi:hypothetical protein
MRNENEGLHRREHRKKKEKFNDGKDVRKWNHKAYTNERYVSGGECLRSERLLTRGNRLCVFGAL